jgi:hypothetical protein
MKVAAAAAAAWKIDTTVVFPQEHVIARPLGLEALAQNCHFYGRRVAS